MRRNGLRREDCNNNYIAARRCTVEGMVMASVMSSSAAPAIGIHRHPFEARCKSDADAEVKPVFS